MRIFFILALTTLCLQTGCANTTLSTERGQNYALTRAYSQNPSQAAKNEKTVPSNNESVSLTLQQCISLALENNPEFAAGQDDIAVAQAKLEGAKAGMWPKISAVGGYTRYKDDLRLVQASYNGEPGLFTDAVLSGDLVLTLPLFSGGQTYNQILASDLLRLSAESKTAFSREELVFNVASVYLTIIAQKRVLESLDRSHTSLVEQTKRIKEMIAAQKAAKVDLLRADVRVADVQQRRIAEQNGYTTTRLALINLMGIEIPEEQLVLAEALQPPATSVDIQTPPLATVLQKRQDYQAAQNALEAQAKMVSVAQGGFFPEVSLKSSYGHRSAVGSSVGVNADSQAELGSIGLMIEIPLFNGGATVAKVREEKAKQSAAQKRLVKLEKQIELEVRTAALNIQSASARIDAARSGQEQAQESSRIERMKYELGKGTIIDTLDSESSLLQADVTYYRALADYHIATAKLRLATGEKL